MVRNCSFTWVFFSCNSSNSWTRQRLEEFCNQSKSYLETSQMIIQKDTRIRNALGRTDEDERYLTLETNREPHSFLLRPPLVFDEGAYGITRFIAWWCLFAVAFDLHAYDATLVHNFLNDVTFLANHFA